jgi:hypothetical protein
MRRRALLFAAAVGVALACSKTVVPARGELMVVISSDLSPDKDFDLVHLEISRPGPDGQPVVFHLADYTFQGPAAIELPATIAIVAADDPALPVTIRLVARQRGRARVYREVRTTVPPDRIAMLPLPIQYLCDGSAVEQPGGDVKSDCDVATEMCIGGACKDENVDASKLPDFSPQAVYGGGTGTGDGACFDALGCFDAATYATPDPKTCTIPAPSGGQGINVAVRLPVGGPGVCASNGCVVPIDQDPIYGWTLAGGTRELPTTIELPTEVCHRGVPVLVSTACKTKTLGLPACGPHTAAGKGGAPSPEVMIPDPPDAGDGGAPCTPNGAMDCADMATPRKCTGGVWQAQPPCAAPTPACSAGMCVTCVEGQLSCLDTLTPQKCVGGALASQPPCSGPSVFCSGTTGCKDREWTTGKPAPPAAAPGQYTAGMVGTVATLTDAVTGLVWQKQPPPGFFNAADAATYCANLSPAGAWRLPTVIELFSLVDTSRLPPPSGSAIDPAFVMPLAGANMWTSTGDPTQAPGSSYYSVAFNNGTTLRATKSATYNLRCVR